MKVLIVTLTWVRDPFYTNEENDNENLVEETIENKCKAMVK